MSNNEKHPIKFTPKCEITDFPVGSKVIMVGSTMSYSKYYFGTVIRATKTTRLVQLVAVKEENGFEVQMAGPYTYPIVEATPIWDKPVKTRKFRYGDYNCYNQKTFIETPQRSKHALFDFIMAYDENTKHYYTTKYDKIEQQSISEDEE